MCSARELRFKINSNKVFRETYRASTIAAAQKRTGGGVRGPQFLRWMLGPEVTRSYRTFMAYPADNREDPCKSCMHSAAK